MHTDPQNNFILHNVWVQKELLCQIELPIDITMEQWHATRDRLSILHNIPKHYIRIKQTCQANNRLTLYSIAKLIENIS